jgi:hypothetical protein
MAKKKWWRTKRSTWVELDPKGESFCRYHYTNVVTWTKDYFILDTGGYDTLTTRGRMHQCALEYELGYLVWRDKGETYLSIRNKHVCAKGDVWSKENRTPLWKMENKRIKRTRKRRPTNCYACTMKLLAEAGGI